MTKTAIDYSKACVYRLIYNDITYYVGSTTNMRIRKSNHKSCCNNNESKDYNYPLYKFIRENGGWGEWSMILIQSYPDCKSSDELRMYERDHYDFYKPNLNKLKPYTSIDERKGGLKQYYFDNMEKINNRTNCVCGGKFTFSHKPRHLKTEKHMEYLKKEADV